MSGRPTRERDVEREAILLFVSSLVFATVEGTQVSGRTAPFAGCRRNEDLGWSATSARESSRSTERTSDNGCSRVAEEGNVVGVRHAHATRHGGEQSPPRFWGRVLRSVLRPAHAHRHAHFTGSKNLAKVARRGTHRPPAILRKQGKRTAGRPRRDARGSQLGHHPPQEVQRGRAKRKRVAAFVQRGKCSSGWCSYVVMQLQKSLGDA